MRIVIIPRFVTTGHGFPLCYAEEILALGIMCRPLKGTLVGLTMPFPALTCRAFPCHAFGIASGYVKARHVSVVGSSGGAVSTGCPRAMLFRVFGNQCRKHGM